VLEAAADYNNWLWHLSYGHCDFFNDINILNRSSLMDMMLDGCLHDLEKEAGGVAFQIVDQTFSRLYFWLMKFTQLQ
jgi:hypothetical protein